MNRLEVIEAIIRCRTEQTQLRKLGRSNAVPLLEALALQIYILEASL